MDKFEQKVFNYIKDNNLINSTKVMLAFSYGVDSRALLEVLLNLKYDVVLVHVNHKVRIESEKEEVETLNLAKSLNLKCYIKHLELKNNNFEDFARRERYNFFKEVARKENTNILLTAHHKDDNLETIILKLINGSNLYGYAGIHNLVYKDNLVISRPFLCVSKNEIREYQKEKGFLYFEDATNSEDFHLRNRIRHHVIPLLKSENPSVLDKAIAYSDQLSTSFDFIRKQSINYLKNNGNKIKNIEFKELDKALRSDIICLLLEKYKINRNTNIINKIDQIILSNKPQASLELSSNYILKKSYDYSFIDLYKKEESFKEISLNFEDKVIFNDFQIYFSKEKPLTNEFYIKLCYNDLEFPLKIRTRLNGDFIKLSGGTKKVKDLFIDKKIDTRTRDRLPLIINKGEIIWIPSVSRSNLCKDGLKNGDIYLYAKEIKNA